MRHFIILLLALSSLSFVTTKSEAPFIGTWKGEDRGEVAYITFDHEGYAILRIGGEVLGGKDFVYKEKKAELKYKVIPNTKPIQLDLIISTNEPVKENKMLCIAEFMSDDTMKFASNFGLNSRPTEFNIKNSIVLLREK
ncbi:hypothetical protein [Flavivirga eckloniae]|uniref:DUF2147 domain-containing protein n=1 Tax=Flavivirga eckloniae TaxID=1803846 RepID=A0A2K9PV96_9FLAO|nr:hypothetical protein [Flavivirga eckloniae]AUP80979.1 hypothetical protein C1H87_20595 [Flavivirga eckloniae]